MARESKHRKRNNRGFTLSETLVALAILVFFGTIVTIGVDVSLKTYRQMTFESNCRMLQDDINTAFGGLVRSTSYVKDSSGTLYLKSDQYSATYSFGKMGLNESGQIYLYAEDTRTKDYADCPLISPGAYDDMTLKDVKLKCSNGDSNVLFTLSYTICSSTGDKTRSYECQYRTVNVSKGENIGTSEKEYNIT